MSDNTDQTPIDIAGLLAAGGGPDLLDAAMIATGDPDLLNTAMANCCREERQREQRLGEARMNTGPTVEISVETYEKLKRAAQVAEPGALLTAENRRPRLVRLK